MIFGAPWMAEQAKILIAEAEENNLGNKVFNARVARWYSCSLCEQQYHGAVRGALGWACWKTYVGRPETDQARCMAMTELGNGLCDAGHDEDALSVREADLAMRLRLGASDFNLLIVQGNLAISYEKLGRNEEALRMSRDVYSRSLKLHGEENVETLRAAYNHAYYLCSLQRYAEARSLLRRTLPVVRRVLGEGHRLTFKMSWKYGDALYKDAGATLDDLREALTALEEAERTARRVFGGAHPDTVEIEGRLLLARAALRARETPSSEADDLAARFGSL